MYIELSKRDAIPFPYLDTFLYSSLEDKANIMRMLETDCQILLLSSNGKYFITISHMVCLLSFECYYACNGANLVIILLRNCSYVKYMC